MRRTLIALAITAGAVGAAAASAATANAAASPDLGGSVYFYGYGSTASAATISAEDQAYNRGCRIIYIGKPFHTTSPLGPWEDIVVGSCP
jgi:hypothetical protein